MLYRLSYNGLLQQRNNVDIMTFIIKIDFKWQTKEIGLDTEGKKERIGERNKQSLMGTV